MATLKRVSKRALAIAWPSFLMAGVLEMLVFSMVDPGSLHWFGGAPVEIGATAFYSLSFFVFWAVIACAGCGYLAAGWQNAEIVLWILAGMAISVTAQAGDLFESGLKRRFKVKDSGTILPGHGGLLDRVDGLGAVSICATLTFLSVPHLPRLLGL